MLIANCVETALVRCGSPRYISLTKLAPIICLKHTLVISTEATGVPGECICSLGW